MCMPVPVGYILHMESSNADRERVSLKLYCVLKIGRSLHNIRVGGMAETQAWTGFAGV